MNFSDEYVSTNYVSGPYYVSVLPLSPCPYRDPVLGTPGPRLERTGDEASHPAGETGYQMHTAATTGGVGCHYPATNELVDTVDDVVMTNISDHPVIRLQALRGNYLIV